MVQLSGYPTQTYFWGILSWGSFAMKYFPMLFWTGYVFSEVVDDNPWDTIGHVFINLFEIFVALLVNGLVFLFAIFYIPTDWLMWSDFIFEDFESRT